MGQNQKAASLSRREYIEPFALGEGAKLAAMASAPPGGLASALVVLLATSSHEEGGDFRHHDRRVVGRWAADRVAIVGEEARPSDLVEGDEAEIVFWLCAPDGETLLGRASNMEESARATNSAEWRRRAARLRECEPFTDITPLVREFMEREGVAAYDAGWEPYVPR